MGPKIGFEAIGVVDSSLPTVAVWGRAPEGDETYGKVGGDGPRVTPGCYFLYPRPEGRWHAAMECV